MIICVCCAAVVGHIVDCNILNSVQDTEIGLIGSFSNSSGSVRVLDTTSDEADKGSCIAILCPKESQIKSFSPTMALAVQVSEKKRGNDSPTAVTFPTRGLGRCCERASMEM